MPFTKYSKYTGVDWESLSLEDLLERLADFLLQSGFDDPYSQYWNEPDQSLSSLRDALMRALMELLSEEELEQLSDAQGNIDAKAMSELLDRLIERLIEEGYNRVDGPLGGICPNCGGNFERRPIRPAHLLAKYPASTQRKGPA